MFMCTKSFIAGLCRVYKAFIDWLHMFMCVSPHSKTQVCSPVISIKFGSVFDVMG